MIIHQTLYDLFPLHTLDPALTAPLTPNDFIRLILVPEVGLRLIMEDQGLAKDSGIVEAVKILRESANYGVAMFPEDGGEWDGAVAGGKAGRSLHGEDEEMGAADLILMERARRRRKELELEEEEEEIFARKVAERERRSGRSAEGVKEKGKEKGKRTGKRKINEQVMELSDSTDVNRPRPKPRTRGKGPCDPLQPQPSKTFSSPPSPSGDDFETRVEDRSDEKQTTPKSDAVRSASRKGKLPKQPKIDECQSDVSETTDSMCSVTRPAKKGITRGKGRKTREDEFESESDNGSQMEMVVPADMTPKPDPRPTLKDKKNVVISTTERATATGPTNRDFYPLKAARDKKHKPAM